MMELGGHIEGRELSGEARRRQDTPSSHGGSLGGPRSTGITGLGAASHDDPPDDAELWIRAQFAAATESEPR
jgi:hypothetical protein